MFSGSLFQIGHTRIEKKVSAAFSGCSMNWFDVQVMPIQIMFIFTQQKKSKKKRKISHTNTN